jgi:hypothetical protein
MPSTDSLERGVSGGGGLRPMDFTFHDPEVDGDGSVGSCGNGGRLELRTETTTALFGVGAG